MHTEKKLAGWALIIVVVALGLWLRTFNNSPAPAYVPPPINEATLTCSSPEVVAAVKHHLDGGLMGPQVASITRTRPNRFAGREDIPVGLWDLQNPSMPCKAHVTLLNGEEGGFAYKFGAHNGQMWATGRGVMDDDEPLLGR